MATPDESVLDNPVWNALSGPQSHLAVRVGTAARFDPAMSPFAGLADDSEASWVDLARVVGPGGTAVLAGGPQRAPAAWREVFRVSGFQMTATMPGSAGEAEVDDPELDDPELVALGDEDAPAMIRLASLTKPGPFESRTHEFGGYVGVSREGRLVAMAGQRLRPPGWTEISAVCTEESARGSGLGSRLVRAVAADIRRRGETPMLHVAGTNVTAIRLYETLGFRKRRSLEFAAFMAPDSTP